MSSNPICPDYLPFLSLGVDHIDQNKQDIQGTTNRISIRIREKTQSWNFSAVWAKMNIINAATTLPTGFEVPGKFR